MSDIVLSYAHADRDRVRQLVESFEAHGWSVWWDPVIRTGSRFDRELEEALSSSRCIVVAWSKASVSSDWVLYEARYGYEADKLVPMFFEHVDLGHPFSLVETLDLVGWPADPRCEPDFRRLLQEIERVLARIDTSIDTSTPVPGFKGRAAVAVLPFAVQAQDHEYIADGLVDDIITGLQRFRTFPVIARNSSFVYDRRQFDFAKIARELGVGYLVVGSLRAQGARVRAKVELIDPTNAHVLWSETYARELDAIADLEAPIATEIVARLEPEIERAERITPTTAREHPDAWHLLRRGIWHQYQLRKDDAATARRYFEQALLRDPDSVEALIQLAWWEWWNASTHRASGDAWSPMEDLANRARSLNPGDPRAIALIGVARMMKGYAGEGRRLFEEALALNPSYAWAYAHLGTSYYLTGEPSRAIEPLQTAMRLSPFDLFVFHAYGELATSYYMLGEWSAAVDAANRSLRLRSGYWLSYVMKTGSLARAGRISDAKSTLAELLKRRRSFAVKDVRWIMFEDSKWNDYVLDGLTMAGWSP